MLSFETGGNIIFSKHRDSSDYKVSVFRKE